MMLLIALLLQDNVVNPGAQRVNPPAIIADPLRDRLSLQTVRGPNRICVYGTGPRARYRAIGRGEPCPIRFVPEEPVQTIVPSMATLQNRRFVNGILRCSYSYAGQTYVATPPNTSICPLTPVGLAQPLVPIAPTTPDSQ